MGFFREFVKDVYRNSNLPKSVNESNRHYDYEDSSSSQSTPEPNSTGSSIDNVVNDNCPDCGGMGRTGGNHSYDTIGGACTSCGGTGKYVR